MQLKTYLKKEQEKISKLTGKQKAVYILEYYWLWILGILLGISFLVFVVYRAAFSIKENWFFAVYANTREEVGNGSELWREYVNFTGYDTREKNVEFQANCYFDPTVSGGTNNSYYQSFVAYVESETLDVVTMEKDALTEVGKTGRLLDLRDERCAAVFEKYQDRLVYCIPYDEDYSTEEVPVGIDLSDSILMTKYHIYDDSCVMGIGAYSQHMDAVEKFLEYVLEE